MVDYCGEEVGEEGRISGGWARMFLGSVRECSLVAAAVAAVAAVGAAVDSVQVLGAEEAEVDH